MDETIKGIVKFVAIGAKAISTTSHRLREESIEHRFSKLDTKIMADILIVEMIICFIILPPISMPFYTSYRELLVKLAVQEDD